MLFVLLKCPPLGASVGCVSVKWVREPSRLVERNCHQYSCIHHSLTWAHRVSLLQKSTSEIRKRMRPFRSCGTKQPWSGQECRQEAESALRHRLTPCQAEFVLCNFNPYNNLIKYSRILILCLRELKCQRLCVTYPDVTLVGMPAGICMQICLTSKPLIFFSTFLARTDVRLCLRSLMGPSSDFTNRYMKMYLP